jgi:hypothetical protein
VDAATQEKNWLSTAVLAKQSGWHIRVLAENNRAAGQAGSGQLLLRWP